MDVLRRIVRQSVAACGFVMFSFARAAPIDIDLPAQDLGSAVRAWSRQTGLPVDVDAGLLADKRAPAVQGRVEPADALRQLLVGSGLRASMQGDRVRITAAGAEPTLKEMIVTGTASAEPVDNPDGSTVASGGLTVRKQSFGPLGEQEAHNLPYSTNSIPQLLIRDQQATSLVDILKNDPSVSVAQTATTQSDTGGPRFNIRGFQLDYGSGVRVDGGATYSITPPPEGLERVDVLKGAAAVLYGFATPAGVVNVVTKKPLDAAFTDVTLGYGSRTQLRGALDASRRFGAGDVFGARINLVKEGGDGPVDQTTLERDYEALALDWRPFSGLRLWTNVSHAYADRHGFGNYIYTNQFASPPVTSIPAPVSPTLQLGQPWTYSKVESQMQTVGVEFVDDDWTVRASYGHSSSVNDELETASTVNGLLEYSVQPDAGRYSFSSHNRTVSVARRFDIGSTHHEISLAHNRSTASEIIGDSGTLPAPLGNSSLYDPVYYPAPSLAELPDAYAFHFSNWTTTLVERADLTKQWTVIVGAVNGHYNLVQGYYGFNSNGTQSRTTPLGALQYKPSEAVTVYTSYISALQPGATAPDRAANKGEQLPPYLGKQYEAGIKTDLPNGLTLDANVFLIDQAYAFLDPTDNVFKSSGSQQNTGIELTATGKATNDLSLFGGLMLQRARIIDNADQVVTAAGNKTIGIPVFKANLLAEYAIGALPGLSLIGGFNHYSATRALVVNKSYLSFPAYTLFDLGAKYETTWSGHPFAARLYVANVANKAYWGGNTFGGLIFNQGDPRTVRATASLQF